MNYYFEWRIIVWWRTSVIFFADHSTRTWVFGINNVCFQNVKASSFWIVCLWEWPCPRCGRCCVWLCLVGLDTKVTPWDSSGPSELIGYCSSAYQQPEEDNMHVTIFSSKNKYRFCGYWKLWTWCTEWGRMLFFWVLTLLVVEDVKWWTNHFLINIITFPSLILDLVQNFLLQILG